MFGFLAVAFLILLIVYYVTKLDFKLGDGFSEEKKEAREGEYRVLDEEEKDDDVKLLDK